MSANPPAQKPAKTGTNLWDALIALFIVGGLVGLVYLLLDEYGDDTERIAAVLGIAAPVLAAGFGVTLGYFTGKEKGEATGQKRGRQEVAAKFADAVRSLEDEGRIEDTTSRLAVERLKGIVEGAS
jgi:hypothetical protein